MKNRRIIAWSSLCAMLLLALMPATARLVAAAEPALPPMVWCAMPGMGREAPPVDDEAPSPRAASAIDCPYCSLAMTPMLPSRASRVPLPVVHGRLMPVRFDEAPRTAFVWASAHARGPPVLA